MSATRRAVWRNGRQQSFRVAGPAISCCFFLRKVPRRAPGEGSAGTLAAICSAAPQPFRSARRSFPLRLLMTVLGVANSFFLQHLVDSVLIRNDVRLLNALGLGMIAAILFRGLYGSIRQYLLAYIGRKVDLALIAAYTRHILRLPLPFFEMRRIGEILSRILDAGKVREAISGTTLTILVDGTLVVLFLVVLWLYDMPLAVAITAFVPLMIVAVMAHHPASKRASRAVMEHASQMWAHLAENVSGVETIKAHGAEDSRADEGENRLVKVVQGLFSLQLLDVSMSSLATVLTGLAGLTVLWVGAYRVMSGALSIGELLFCYSLVSYMLGPLERLAGINLKIQDALVAVDRLFQIMDLEPEVLDDPHKIPFTGVRTAIVFQDVSFSYGHRAPVLEDICMRIPAGKVVAVVGESGSGKSTLLKLLLGFYRPTAGRSVDRWRGPGRLCAGLVAKPDADRVAGPVYFHWHDSRECGCRRAPRKSGAGQRSDSCGRPGRIREQLARALRDDRRRTRLQFIGRTTPASGHRPGALERARGPDL